MPSTIDLFIFAIGLHTITQSIRAVSTQTKKAEEEDKRNKKPWPSLYFLLGLIGFCFICGVIILATKNQLVDDNVVAASNQFSNGAQLSRVLANMIGLLGLVHLSINAGKLLIRSTTKSKRLDSVKSDPEDQHGRVHEIVWCSDLGTFIICLSAAIFAYCLIAPKAPPLGFVYDTGLYHLPFVNHIGILGLSDGLASLDMRYGFLNINLLGQVPFQAPLIHDQKISASINILYFCAFLYFACDTLKRRYKTKAAIGLDPTIFILICAGSWGAGLTESTLQYSLASYNADFAIAILGLVVIYFMTHYGDFRENSWQVILLIFFAPVIKSSGITICIMALLAAIAFGCLRLYQKGKINNMQFVGIAQKLPNLNKAHIGYAFISIITVYSLCALFNQTTSGYPLYPSNLLGNGENFGISPEVLTTYRNTWILDWARSPNIHDSHHGTSSNWFVSFISTQRGLFTLGLWLGPLLLAVAVLAVLNKKHLTKSDTINSLVSNAVGLCGTSVLILIAMPPERRFYMWLAPACIYVTYLTFQALPRFKYASTIFICLAVSPSLIWQLKDLKNSALLYGKSASIGYLTSIQQKPGISYWSDRFWKNGKINTPTNNDQCWTSLPPCTNHQISRSQSK